MGLLLIGRKGVVSRMNTTSLNFSGFIRLFEGIMCFSRRQYPPATTTLPYTLVIRSCCQFNIQPLSLSTIYLKCISFIVAVLHNLWMCTLNSSRTVDIIFFFFLTVVLEGT